MIAQCRAAEQINVLVWAELKMNAVQPTNGIVTNPEDLIEIICRLTDAGACPIHSREAFGRPRHDKPPRLLIQTYQEVADPRKHAKLQLV